MAFGKFAAKWVTESSRDPLILGGVTVLLVLAAAAACFVTTELSLVSLPSDNFVRVR